MLAQRESTASTVLNLQMRREHQLSMALVSGSTGDPDPRWLDHTTARLGCLGLWSADREEGGERQHLLTMTGAYARRPPFASPRQSGSRTSPTGLSRAQWAPGDIGW